MLWFGKRKERLKQSRVAVLVADGVEQAQLDAAVKKLRAAGSQIFIVGVRGGKARAFHALKPSVAVPIDATVDEVHPASFQALVIPGGSVHADRLRQSPAALEFIRDFNRAKRPIAAIGHAAAVLASAGVVAARRLTGWPGIRDDIANAGGVWLDEPYVVDENLLTGRTSRDAGKWSKQLVKHVGRLASVENL
jgi:protease I